MKNTIPSSKSQRLTLSLCLLISTFVITGCPSGDDPAGAQGSTNAPTDLSGVAQNWDKNLPNTSRFTVLAVFNNQAVRDNNTGLVWEKAPDSTTRPWASAIAHCVDSSLGGTGGWRLPSVVELKSIEDTSLPQPFVPTSLFTIVTTSSYWTATTLADSTSLQAWGINFASNSNSSVAVVPPKTSLLIAWCVRGGLNASAY